MALHVPTDREEVVKTLRLRDLPHTFIERYLDEYRKIAGLEQRNVLTVFEVGQTADVAYVSTEFLAGGSLIDAIRKKLPVGLALNCLAQMCLALDAIHGLGIVHGALRARHFLFREDRVLVLADFNATQRVSESLGLLQSQVDVRTDPRQQEHGVGGTRADFLALGRILHEMVTGETSLSGGPAEGARAEELFKASRLPLPLSPLQPCLDGLLGIGSAEPFERAEDVLVGLLGLKEIFPFDIRYTDGDGVAQAKKIGRR
jgi:serine/threonine-protein kinase